VIPAAALRNVRRDEPSGRLRLSLMSAPPYQRESNLIRGEDNHEGAKPGYSALSDITARRETAAITVCGSIGFAR
jgi:hypothetical protein